MGGWLARKSATSAVRRRLWKREFTSTSELVPLRAMPYYSQIWEHERRSARQNHTAS